MLEDLRAKRRVRRNARYWAAEAISDYGPDAEKTLRSCLRHPGYQGPERYCLEQVLREVRRMQSGQGWALPVAFNPVGFVFGWLAMLWRVEDNGSLRARD